MLVFRLFGIGGSRNRLDTETKARSIFIIRNERPYRLVAAQQT